MIDLDERPWFAFAMTVPPIDGVRQPTTNYVPANDERSARERMRRTVDPKLAHLVDTWPLIGTRFCSREALTKSLIRRRR